MPHQKLCHGAGAICEVLLRYLHSRPVVSTKYPNASFNQCLGGLLCIREEMKTVNNKQVMCFVFRHDDFEGVKLHCVWRWSKVTTEGDPEHFFRSSTQVAASNEEEGATEHEVLTLEEFEYDVQHLCAEGYDVDDDNEPASENMPTNKNEPGAEAQYSKWGVS